jgi:hypothetical protein
LPKLLHAVAAMSVCWQRQSLQNAADMELPEKAPPPVMPLPFSWTGFYIGGNLGGAWAHRNMTDSLFGLSFSNETNNGAFIGGGQIGATIPRPELLFRVLREHRAGNLQQYLDHDLGGSVRRGV